MELPLRQLCTLLLVSAVLLGACERGGEPQPTPTPSPSASETPSPSPTLDDNATTAAPCSDPALSRQALEALPGLAEAPGRIAFVCQGQIWTMRPDGTDHRRVTEATAIEYSRVRLYNIFEDRPPRTDEIAVVERNMNGHPQWLPDGQIVFDSMRDTLLVDSFLGATELYVVNGDGSGLMRVTDYNLKEGSYPRGSLAGQVIVAPLAVSPDGRKVALDVVEIKFSECCFFAATIDLDTLEFEPLPPALGEIEGISVHGWAWAPDGKQAALRLIRMLGDPFGDGAPVFQELTVRNLTTAADTLIYRAGTGQPLAGLGPPAWSPADDLIAFCGLPTVAGSPTVYVIDAAGGDPRPLRTLATPPDPSPLFLTTPWECVPSWSPDGKHLVVDSNDGAILVSDIQSGASAKVSLGGQPSWGRGDELTLGLHPVHRSALPELRPELIPRPWVFEERPELRDLPASDVEDIGTAQV